MKDCCQPQAPAHFVKITRQASRFQRAGSDGLPALFSTHRRWKWTTISFFGLMFFLFGNLTVQAETSMSEYHLKALFLLNFLGYVDWPTEPTSPIIIGILGQDNFGDYLKDAIAGKKIDGREIIIRHLSANDDPDGCAILFISSSESSQLEDILGKTSRLPILTVGEDDSFLKKGGIINFTLKEGKIRLEINLKAARKVRLEISSKLLSVADVVKE